jgi:hypothetical protein
MPPLSLSDEELSLLRSLAEAVAYGQRREFLQAVAAALEACPQSGLARRTALRAMFNAGSSLRRSGPRPRAKRRGPGGRRTALKLRTMKSREERLTWAKQRAAPERIRARAGRYHPYRSSCR